MTNDTTREQTDGFHLLIDALKLNGIENIYALPGIPITDLTRKAPLRCSMPHCHRSQGLGFTFSWISNRSKGWFLRMWNWL